MRKDYEFPDEYHGISCKLSAMQESTRDDPPGAVQARARLG